MTSPFEDEASERLFAIIHMLQRSALLNMGGIADSEGMIHFDLGEAKEAIDLLAAVQAKTSNNLSDQERALLRGIISELRCCSCERQRSSGRLKRRWRGKRNSGEPSPIQPAHRLRLLSMTQKRSK